MGERLNGDYVLDSYSVVQLKGWGCADVCYTRVVLQQDMPGDAVGR